jgi:hypothetical protein
MYQWHVPTRSDTYVRWPVNFILFVVKSVQRQELRDTVNKSAVFLSSEVLTVMKMSTLKVAVF